MSTGPSYAAKYPTHCEHDVLYVPGVDFGIVSDEDRERLEELGFTESEYGGFKSTRFVAC